GPAGPGEHAGRADRHADAGAHRAHRRRRAAVPRPRDPRALLHPRPVRHLPDRRRLPVPGLRRPGRAGRGPAGPGAGPVGRGQGRLHAPGRDLGPDHRTGPHPAHRSLARRPGRARRLGRPGLQLRRPAGGSAGEAQRIVRHVRPSDGGDGDHARLRVHDERHSARGEAARARDRAAHRGDPGRGGRPGRAGPRAARRRRAEVSLRGLAWDHPRAYQPLEAFAKEYPSPAVSWDRQSLADFEARPVTELARQYDVMIIDHPGLGAAIAAGAIQPLRRLVPRDVIEEWKATSFVPTWDSYMVGGQPWALPVDAATQVSVFRPDLLPGAPGSWAEVPALAREHRVALCLGGPHAFLAVLGMCAPGESLLPPAREAARDLLPAARDLLPAARDLLPAARDLLPADCAVTAIELLRAIWRHADREVSAGDPIAVHEAMAAAADLAYCPLAYGYASYARPAP